MLLASSHEPINCHSSAKQAAAAASVPRGMHATFGTLCRAIVVLSERVEYTVQRALFRSLGTALGGAVAVAVLLHSAPVCCLAVRVTLAFKLLGELEFVSNGCPSRIKAVGNCCSGLHIYSAAARSRVQAAA